MKKSGFIITIFVLLIIVLSVIQAIVSNRLSTKGVFISKIEEEINNYKLENAVLSSELLEASSLTNLASKATGMGFISSKTQFVLGNSQPLAIRQ